MVITRHTSTVQAGQAGEVELDIWHPSGAVTKVVEVDLADGTPPRRLELVPPVAIDVLGVRFAVTQAGRFDLTVSVETSRGCVASAVGRPRQIHVQ